MARECQDVLRAESRRSRDFGDRRPGRLADGSAELLQAELVRAGQVARVRRQRGALQVRLDIRQGVAEAGLDRPRERSLRADEAAGRDEELGHVDRERRLRRARRRSREVDEHGPVLGQEYVAQVETPVGDPRLLQLVNLVPQLDEHLVGDVFGTRDLQGRDIRLTGGDERIALRAERGDDDVGDPHARLRGHEEREPLVLDLLQAPDRGAARRIAISEEAPAPREPLRAARRGRGHGLEAAPRRRDRRTGRSRPAAATTARALDSLHAKGGQRGANVRGRRNAGGLPEGEPHDRPRSDAESQGAERRRREPRAEHDRADGGEWEHPNRQPPGRVHELRAGNHDDRGRNGQPKLRVAPVREQVTLDRNPVGLDDAVQHEGRTDDEQAGDDQIPGEAPPPAQQHLEHNHQREGEQPDEGDSPERVRPRENGLERSRHVLVVALLAVEATTAVKPITIAARSRKNASIVRRFRRPGSVSASRRGSTSARPARRCRPMHSGCHDGTSRAAAALRRTHLAYGGQTMPLTRRIRITSSGEVSAAQAQGSTTRPRHSRCKYSG